MKKRIFSLFALLLSISLLLAGCGGTSESSSESSSESGSESETDSESASDSSSESETEFVPTGPFLTVSFEDMALTLDLDAYLATLGLTYQDCYDYPDYVTYYTESAFIEKLLGMAEVDWSNYANQAALEKEIVYYEQMASYYYNYYGGAEGTDCETVDEFAPLLFAYDGTKYKTVREWKETTLKRSILEDELFGMYIEYKELEPSEDAVDEAYDDLLDEIMLQNPGMSKKDIEDYFAAQEGEDYLRNYARGTVLSELFTKHLTEDWTVTHAEAVPVEIDKSPIDPSKFTETDEVTTLVKITFSGGVSGDVYVRLYPDQAPITVANFQNLVQQGFYNGLKFHRSIKDFCLQGGDPKGDGTGGSDTEIKGEFLANGWGNHLHHLKGVVSMARANGYDSASSQFFFTMSDSAAASLDGQYAAFGYVVAGWEVVEAASKIETNSNDLPSVSILMEKITFVTPVAE